MLTPMRWTPEGFYLLDQRLLPHEERWNLYETVEEVAEAIRSMVVRGAPALGLTAAYGMALAAKRLVEGETREGSCDAPVQESQALMNPLLKAATVLTASRPTAVNLEWAVKLQLQVAAETAATAGQAGDLYGALLEKAQQLHDEDIRANRNIGRHGAGLLRDGDRVLTHCNAGALATGGYGTALGVIRFAHQAGMNVHVYATETRPYLQGARLTAWELVREGIPVTLIVDSAAGMLMQRGDVDAVVVGADRIAANGDTANKIGTYQLALAAQENSIPFYVAAPISTLDLEIPDGSSIKVERRGGDEVTRFKGESTAPDMVEAVNFAFDITPARFIRGVITENGVARSPLKEGLERMSRGREPNGGDTDA
ncbi:MAG: S-methyl-5-thioribose-1-phosphate isomerase [Bacillota bacterium]